MVAPSVILCPETWVEWYQIAEEEKSLEVNGIGLEEWECKYPGLFKNNVQYGYKYMFKKLTICHKEIAWKIKS